MYRTEVLVNYGGLDNLNHLVEAYPTLPVEIAERLVQQYEYPILQELSYTPPPAKHPIAWTSERQRKYVMMLLRSMNNLPYHRTGRMNRGYRIEVLSAPGGIAIRLTNVVPYTMFVVGRLRPRGSDPMQQFHKNTGWQPAAPTIEYWGEALRGGVQTELKRFLGGLS